MIRGPDVKARVDECLTRKSRMAAVEKPGFAEACCSTIRFISLFSACTRSASAARSAGSAVTMLRWPVFASSLISTSR